MDWAHVTKLLATALGAIDQVLETTRMAAKAGGRVTAAADALTAIGAIVETVKNGDIENLDPTVAEEELTRLLAAIQSNDDEADAAVAEKFDSSDNSGS